MSAEALEVKGQVELLEKELLAQRQEMLFQEFLKKASQITSRGQIKGRSCFISYAWEDESTVEGKKANEALQSWLRRMTQDLSQVGIQIFLDIKNMQGDMEECMKNNIVSSDYILLIGTPRYKSRASQNTNVAFELKLILEKVAQGKNSGNNNILLPLLYSGDFGSSFPEGVTKSLVRDFRDAKNYYHLLGGSTKPLGLVPDIYPELDENGCYYSEYFSLFQGFYAQIELLQTKQQLEKLSVSRRKPSIIDIKEKKDEREKTQVVLEALRNLFLEERDIGEKTENYNTYNEYLGKTCEARLVYQEVKKKHILDVRGQLFESQAAASEILQIMRNRALPTLPSTLIEAIKQNNQETFFKFLTSGKNALGKNIIDERNEQGGNPLHTALTCGHLDFISPLIKARVDVNQPDNDEWTPAYIAAEKGYAETIRLLHAAKADVNTPNSDGVTPVCVAAENGHIAAIRTLAALGANMDKPENKGLTPIFIAAQAGDATTVSVLLEAGANASIKTPEGSPLEQAKKGRQPEHWEVVSLLETHLKQYPNGIKTQMLANTELAPEAHQKLEDLAESPGYGNLHLEVQGRGPVITITDGVRAQDGISIGGGHASSSPEPTLSNLDADLKEEAEVDNVAVLNKLKIFFMSNKYKGSESQDCELYNRVLDRHKAVLIYLEDERMHKLFINDESLEQKDSIKKITQMIESLKPKAQSLSEISRPSTPSSTHSVNTRIQVRAGGPVITIAGGVRSGGRLDIGNTHHNFRAYDQFKNQNTGKYNGILVNQTEKTGLALGISKAIKSINRVKF